MADGIGKGITQQLGELGKQIVNEVAQTPAKLTGMGGSTNETAGQATATGKGQQQQTPAQSKATTENINPIDVLKRQDEIKTQQELAKARQLLQPFIKPTEAPQSIREQNELEEMEKQKQDIIAQQKKAKEILPQMSSKPKPGNLYGKQTKTSSELGKNRIAQ